MTQGRYVRRWMFALCLALGTMFCGLANAGMYGEYDQRVGKGMGLISVFPGKTHTSTPLTIRVKSSKIPEGAIVESVTVVTGSITADKRLNAAVVINTYNIEGPGMEKPASLRWAGKGRPTKFTEDDLGGGDIPVAGTWRLSMTGNNVGIARGTTSHTIRTLKFRYRY